MIVVNHKKQEIVLTIFDEKSDKLRMRCSASDTTMCDPLQLQEIGRPRPINSEID